MIETAQEETLRLLKERTPTLREQVFMAALNGLCANSQSYGRFDGVVTDASRVADLVMAKLGYEE